MNKLLRVAAAAAVLGCPAALPAFPAHAQTGPAARTAPIKTRLDHLSGTHWVLVISYLPAEITSVTCDSWTMLGVKSWQNQNNFTIPSGPAVALMDANKFDGYCVKEGSIVAHTDDGDFPGTLDRGNGNWKDSTKLTFSYNSARTQ